MIIDCHAHLEPRMLDVDSMRAKLSAAGVDRVVLIPAMNDPIPEVPQLLLRAVRTAMQRGGTRLAAELVHRTTMRENAVHISGADIPIYPQPDNATVAQLVEAHPDTFMGWIFLNPKVDDNALETLERWRAIPGMIGVKLHPHWHDYKTSILGPVLGRCEELGLPVLMHLGFRKRGDFRSICEKYPRLTLISAHAGFPFFKDLWAYKNDYPGLYVDLSSPYLNEALARRTVDAMGAHRCLYGTDAPYGFHETDGTYDYGEIRRWIQGMSLAADDIEQVLGGTFGSLIST